MPKIALLLLCVTIAALAEPPVPQGQYGAPSGQYGPPGRFGGSQGGYPSGFNGNGGSSGYGGNGGSSGFGGNGEDGNSEPANYEFQYDVDAPDYNVKFGHQEARQGDVAEGKYYVLLPDGRTQLVEYVADENGYQPKISYEEPEGYGRGGPNGQGGAEGYGRGGPNGQGGAEGYGRGGPNGQGGPGGYNR